MIDKIIAMLRHSNKCKHKHTFDILFTGTDKDNMNHDFLLTICDDCKKLISYTDIEAEIKELKKKSERAIKVLQERCDKCSIHGVTSYCSKCQVSKAASLLTEGTTPSEE